MGLRMDDLHAPSVASGPTSQPAANGAAAQQSLPELIAKKESLEAELAALGSVLDSVCRRPCVDVGESGPPTNHDFLARRRHEHVAHDL